MGFKGCIRELETENKDLRENPVDLMISVNTDPGRVFHRVKKCGCKDLECQNDGNCQERPPDFRCQCKPGYTGPQCQISGEYNLKFCGWHLRINRQLSPFNSYINDSPSPSPLFLASLMNVASLLKRILGSHTTFKTAILRGAMRAYCYPTCGGMAVNAHNFRFSHCTC